MTTDSFQGIKNEDHEYMNSAEINNKVERP